MYMTGLDTRSAEGNWVVLVPLYYLAAAHWCRCHHLSALLLAPQCLAATCLTAVVLFCMLFCLRANRNLQSQALARAVQKATGCAGVRVRQNNGPAAGQVVPQLHFHVIPVEAPDDEVRTLLPSWCSHSTLQPHALAMQELACFKAAGCVCF
jgi:hypothetical protein